MAADEKWYFAKEELANTPSRKCGYDADKELSCRQQAANFIQDMGQRLQVTQLCINTAIVYMHRFYMFHSFTRFHRNAIAAAALFLAAKVEEQPRKLEHVIKVAQMCLHRDQGPLDIKSEYYLEQAQELVVNENILLQTLGFDVAIDHPHTHVVRCCHLVGAHKDLAQTSYFMASNSLHLTTMCLQYKPTVVACFCIHLACKWSNWEIPQSNEGKPWFWYIDKSVTQELLEQLTEEFLVIFEKCPSRLKKKIMSLSSSQHSSCLSAFNNEGHEKKRNGEAGSSSQNQNQGLSFTGAGPSGMTAISDDTNMKKKMEYAQRHHQDYKKAHLPHHSRPDQNIAPNKSSCMFGLPQRTVPSSHNSGSSNSIRNTLGPPPTQSNSLPAPRSHHKAHPHPMDPRPRRPPPPPHVELQPLPFKKEHHHVPYSTSSPYQQQQPSTVAEVPKLPPKPERSIFSPEVASTPEQPKPEPVLRLKEEVKSPRVDEVAQPPPPKSPLEPLSLPPVVKEEKIDPKVEERITETKLPEPRKRSVSPITISTSNEEHHKEAKKKKKKHKEHKEKHRDKHKHKKDKHKEPGPIVITIPKDKLLSIPKEVPRELPLKIKIPKDKIGPLANSPVKLKIPREKLKESRKRERSPSPAVTSKHPRPNGTVQVNLELNKGVHETWEQPKTEGNLGSVGAEDAKPGSLGDDRSLGTMERKSELSRGRTWVGDRNVRELIRRGEERGMGVGRGRGVGGRPRGGGARGRGRGWHQAPQPIPSYIPPPYLYRPPAPLRPHPPIHPHSYSYYIIPAYPPPPPLPEEPPPPQPPPPPPE